MTDEERLIEAQKCMLDGNKVQADDCAGDLDNPIAFFKDGQFIYRSDCGDAMLKEYSIDLSKGWHIYEEKPKNPLSEYDWFDEEVMEYQEIEHWNYLYEPTFKALGNYMSLHTKGFYRYVFETLECQMHRSCELEVYYDTGGNTTHVYCKGYKPAKLVGVVVFKKEFYE